MLIAQVSDFHVITPGADGIRPGDTDTFAALDRCVDALAALTPRPDVVLACGDLVHCGGADDYRKLSAILARLDVPIFVAPGNNDHRANLWAVFGKSACPSASDAFLHYAVETFPVRLIAVDTLDPGRTGGRLCEERLSWLDAVLNDQPNRPTLLFMHHVPFVTGMTAFDSDALIGADGLEHVVRAHPNVERILCGHMHRPAHAPFAGTTVTVTPSVSFGLALDLTPGSTIRPVRDPVAFQLHQWRPGAGWVSYLSYI
ncbi:MAG: phosphodiesterase [Alphaproteobacteria bacterium]|nr:phosphodiesterase [Alphaproteobacteria bacterium]